MLNVSSRCKFVSSVLQDYPEDDMEVEPSMCVSYAKSPYKKTRRSICKVTMVLDLILIYNILYTRYIIYIYIRVVQKSKIYSNDCQSRLICCSKGSITTK